MKRTYYKVFFDNTYEAYDHISDARRVARLLSSSGEDVRISKITISEVYIDF